MVTKDDALADAEEEVAEAKKNTFAEQVAIRIVMHGTPEEVAINQAEAVQNLQDHATPDQLVYDDNDQPIGYIDTAMQDLTLPKDWGVARRVQAVARRIRDGME